MYVAHNVPLKDKTTFRIGGEAREYAVVRTKAELIEALSYATLHQMPYHILAGGSNTLVADEGFEGLVIHIELLERVQFQNTITIGAGRNLWSEILAASDSSLGGWESLAGIPGTVGGAVRGNAGAFGSEIKDVVKRITALHNESHEVKIFSNNECEFDYRDSFFKQNPEWIILSCEVELQSTEPGESRAKSEETVREREKRHLQNVACAGSYFMNPVAPRWVVEQFEDEKKVASRNGRVPAGWLIEKVGMKGASVGGAHASAMHPNYLMNSGNATAQDVLTLAEHIKDAVASTYMTHLFEEVTKVGIY